MCGISGYIGESKKPILTYQLITKLFEKSESRGIDAAGYWGTEGGKDGKVLYHKEPGRASNLVKQTIWKQAAKYKPNLLLVHARGASKGMGEPSINANNHPFTNSNKSVGLVHNGRVDDNEYNLLKQKYTLSTQCDSEILLRILESGETYSQKELKDSFGNAEFPQRLAGIRDIFSLINEGHMAVAIGERGDSGERMIWLFRNRHRPLWIVDMRSPLGQVFFVSEPSIWEDAISECSGVKSIARTQKLIELPTDEVWYFKTTIDEPYAQSVKRYEVCKEGYVPWKFDGKTYSPPKRPQGFEVVTRLDDTDRIMQNESPSKPLVPQLLTWENFSLNDLNTRCETIVTMLDKMKVSIENMRSETAQQVQAQTMSKEDFDRFLQDLGNLQNDLSYLNNSVCSSYLPI